MIRKLAVLVAGVGAVALSGCGAQEASVVKGAFSKSISSANMNMTMSMAAPGGESTISLKGPYKNNGKGKLPSADLKLQVAGAMPQPIEAELFSTGEDAFVVYDGQTYQVGKDNIAKLKMKGAVTSGNTSQMDIGKMLIKMQDWFPESNAQENASLNGEDVTRITGKLDLSKALADMKDLAKEPGMSGFEGLKQLSGGDLRKIEKSVSDPKFTVDVAKSDGKLRRIAATMNINESGQKGKIAFSLQLTDVDKPVTINAPSSGKPIQELLKKLQQDFAGSQPESSTIS